VAGSPSLFGVLEGENPPPVPAPLRVTPPPPRPWEAANAPPPPPLTPEQKAHRTAPPEAPPPPAAPVRPPIVEVYRGATLRMHIERLAIVGVDWPGHALHGHAYPIETARRLVDWTLDAGGDPSLLPAPYRSIPGAAASS
jgi:hypothetical protein